MQIPALGAHGHPPDSLFLKATTDTRTQMLEPISTRLGDADENLEPWFMLGSTSMLTWPPVDLIV